MSAFDTESQERLAARLADVEGEISDMEARPVMCRDFKLLWKFYVQRSAIKRAMNGRAA